MSDELTPLEVATRKSFRAFYGDDDPIQFSDLTKEQRQKFEAVALSFQDKNDGDEIERFYGNLVRLHSEVTEILASMVGGKAAKSFSDAIALKDYSRAFDIMAEPLLKPIDNLRSYYERRFTHR